MIIVLEGPDGGGKTTLAHQLCKLYNLEYHHEDPPPPKVNVLEHYGLLLEAARDRNVVFDRLAYGETVYGPIMRGTDRLGRDGWRVFNRLMMAVGAFHVLVLPPWETCLDNWRAKRTGDYVQDELLYREIHREYRVMPHDLLFDYTQDELVGPGDHMHVALKRKQALPRGLIGSPTAKYLLVGERGGNILSPLDLPFFGTDNSAQYLNRALDLAEFEEKDLAFVNAYLLKSAVPNNIPRFERVIALGEKAADVCEAQHIEHTIVPHPQFWRRFHYYDVQSYADMLSACKIP